MKQTLEQFVANYNFPAYSTQKQFLLNLKTFYYALETFKIAQLHN